MNFDIKKLILKKLSKKDKIKVADIVKATGFSRAYINRFFKELKKEGKIALIGKANKAHYIFAEKEAIKKTKEKILKTKRILKNKNLSEDIILNEVKENTGIFLNIRKNVIAILDYAFTEMLNNAIVHSRSGKIIVVMEQNKDNVNFEIIDFGIGIFNNIMKKRKQKNELEAIQSLLKGKQTTLPKEHSGEGIFFTSKVADKLVIQSSIKKLIFDNLINDIFIKDVKATKGTKIKFLISKNVNRNIIKIFKEFSDKALGFDKTKVKIDLYKANKVFVSRSQAKRVLIGLEKFKIIILDFENVKTVGQGFADEVFRVWQNRHPNIKIKYQNANDNILFMIRRTLEH